MLRFTLIVVTLIVVSATLAFAVLPPDGWRDTLITGADEANDHTCRIASCGGNMIHETWLCDEMFISEVWYQRSPDNGFSWCNSWQLSMAASIGQKVWEHAVAADGNGNVSCVWSQWWSGVGYHVRLWWSRSQDNGLTWTEPVDITDDLELPGDAVAQMQPSLAVDDAGRLHLAFFYVRVVGSNQVDLQVCYASHPDAGGGWTHYETVDDLGVHAGGAYWLAYPAVATAGSTPHVIYAQNEGLDDDPARYFYLWHAERGLTGEWQRSQIDYDDSRRVWGTDLTYCVNDTLHAIWIEDQGASDWHYYARSTDNGLTWPIKQLLSEGWDAAIGGIAADCEGVHVIDDNGFDIYYHRSTDRGETWLTPQLIFEGEILSGLRPTDLITNYSGRHVVFENWGNDDYIIGYLANDDTLLSDSPEATAFSSGRHLVRDPMNNRLHLVYFSQDRPHYTYSDDEGSTWAPYHIIENLDQTGKDIGIHPSIGICWTPMAVNVPCMAYVTHTIDGDTLKYRWWNEFAGQWQGFYVYGAGIYYGAPSVMCFGSDVGLVVVSEDISQSWVLYYQFPYNAPAPDYTEVIASGLLNRFRSPCLTVDGNWDRHVIYEDNGEIVYMRRFAPYDWRPYPPFPPTPLWWSQTPFIEAYGDIVYAPYSEQDRSSPLCDVYRRYYNLYEMPPQWSPQPFPVSQSVGIPSESPVAAWGDFTVWAEQAPGDIEFDSKYYWHPQDQTGFISMEPLNSYHHHAQMYYDWLGGSTVLMTAWTLGLLSTAPYRIAFRRMSLLPPPDGFGSYYTVTTGEDKPSFFCSKRDTFVRYQRYKVDYGKTELSYQLSLLNPVYPAYRVKILSYFEGSSNRTEQVSVDGRSVEPITIRPNVLNTAEVLIPREYYQNDHHASLTFKGSDVTKAGLVVYQLEKAKVGCYSGGGSQSSETSRLSTETLFQIEPNPSRGWATVTYGLSQEAEVKCGLYDASGRLVQMLVSSRQGAGVHRLSLPSQLSAGVYFVKLNTDRQSLVKKVAVMR